MSLIDSLICFMPLEKDLSFTVGTGPATFSRATSATFLDRITGLVTTAAIDEPRFESAGMLLEGASTNQMLFSEDFTDAAWNKTAATVTPNSTTAPDGAPTTDLIVPTTATSTHIFFQNSTIVNGGEYTQSIYVKASGYNFIQIAGSSGFDGANAWANFDLVTGTVGNTGSVGTADIQDIGNGFFRCSFTVTALASGSGRMIFSVLPSDIASRVPSFTGDGVSGIFAWGGQMERVPMASSYLKTTGSTTTRSIDLLDISPSNIPGITADYTLRSEADVLVLSENGIQSEQTLWWVDGESFRFGRVNQFGVGNSTMDFRSGSVSVVSPAPIPIGSPVVLTFVSDSLGTIDLYQDGTSLVSASYGLSPTGVATSISLGRRPSTGDSLYGHMKELRIYDKALTPEEVLQDLNFDFFAPRLTNDLTFDLTRPLTTNLTG